MAVKASLEGLLGQAHCGRTVYEPMKHTSQDENVRYSIFLEKQRKDRHVSIEVIVTPDIR